MAKHPFWTISIYKVLLVSIVIANFLESNQIRENFFVKMSWHTEQTWYAPLLFLYVILFMVWGIIYLVEVSFGLTMGAFRLRSRAGVARWFDMLILIIVFAVAYEAWVIPSRGILVSDVELYAFSSDSSHLFSQFLIWILTVTFVAALQSLSPWGEYRFDRTQTIGGGQPVVPTSTPLAAETFDATNLSPLVGTEPENNSDDIGAPTIAPSSGQPAESPVLATLNAIPISDLDTSTQTSDTVAATDVGSEAPSAVVDVQAANPAITVLTEPQENTESDSSDAVETVRLSEEQGSLPGMSVEQREENQSVEESTPPLVPQPPTNAKTDADDPDVFRVV